MKELFEITERDKAFYNEKLKDFLPGEFVDIHTHVWLDAFMKQDPAAAPSRSVSWPSLVAKDNSMEDLNETYRLMFPGKKVTPVIFSDPNPALDLDAGNAYIRECALKTGCPSLLLAHPSWSAEETERQLAEGGFLGLKVYLNYAPVHIAVDDIEIFDFAPRHQLEVLDRRGGILMLHIPRPGRLRDPVNLEQLMIIENEYPSLKLIVAHVGRAYCDEDIGNAFEVLSPAKNMMFDIAANCNETVFRRLIAAVGPGRILFGSDMPILRMRCRRITENGRYVNLVPEGLYGDLTGDKNMRAVSGEDAAAITFFMYEEIDAFRRAAAAEGLTRADIADVFCNNALRILGR